MNLKGKYYKKVTIFNTKFYFCYKNQPPNRENIVRKENVMNNKKIFEKIITEKRAKSSNERPKYGLRKLTVGVVSCLLGYMMFFTPNVVAAEKVDQPQAVEATVELTEANNVENVEEESEQPKEAAAEIAETEQPVSHVQAYSSQATETNAQDRSVKATAEETSEATTEESSEKTTEFKLTEKQKKQLEEAGFDAEQIQKIENDIKLELQKDPNYDVEKHIKDAIEKLNQPELALAPKAPATGVRDAAPPEDTTTSADAKNAVHGYVGVLVGGDINADLGAETGQRFKPIQGVKVYFQWYEKTGNRTSPTYYAVSGADGQFHIKMKPYIGEDGKLVKFDADTTVSAGNESYKMWVDESTIPEGYQLQYSTGEGVEFTDRKVAGGDYQLGPNRLINYRVLLMKKQDEAKMHKKATPTGPQIFADPVGNVGQGAVRGKVSWDYESAGGVQWGIVSTPTSPAKGVTVTASYLSDYALKQIYSADTANMLGVSKPSDIRGRGWIFKLETQLQEWIAEQVAADKDKWIAETVSAVTNAEGDYKIQFKGTWGPKWNDESVASYTPPRTWSEEEKARLGTVAENAEDGSFLSGALPKNQKHINSNWLFISTKGTDNVVLRTPWNYNWYTGSDDGWGIHRGWAQAAFGVSTVQAAHSTRADFNLAPAEIKFNITNFDTQANTATPGDVAKTNTQGLPYKNTNDSFKIVWYDQNGNKLKEEPTQNPTSTGALAEATFDTKDIKETKTFIAKLHYVDSKGNLGQVLAQDAFTVKVGKIVVSAYDDVNIANPAAKENEGATYKAEGLPEGLTIDKNTGTVSGKAKVPGKYTVTVATSILDEDSGEIMEGTSNYTALVTDSPLEHGEVGVEYNKIVKPAEVEGYVFKNVSAKFIDGKAIDGLTIAGDQISGTPTVKVEATQEDPNVEVTYDIYKLNDKGEEVLIKKGHVDKVPLVIKDGETTNYEPKYEVVDGKVGEPATVKAPTFTDKEGNPATPEDVTYKLGEGAPTGAKVNADGSVTYTPVEGDAEKAVKIPVVVKYSDGTTDNVNAVINVSKKATIADQLKELGGISPETIKVWKGDDIDWKDGVKPNNTTNAAKVWELIEQATVTDITQTTRDSSKDGKFEGKLKLSFNDGSSIEVENQWLYVSDHVVVIDPNDPKSPSKDDLPRDNIEVRFVGLTGIKEIKTTGTTYVKPGTVFQDTDFPEVTVDTENGYDEQVTWTPANRAITKKSPAYSKLGYFQFRASATLADIIDRTGHEDKATPEGYVRVTFKAGDGVKDIANNKVYDVKIGTKLTADKYPEVTAKDGYEKLTWSTAPGTAITADNATITATATKTTPAVEAEAEQVEFGGTYDLTDNIKNLPEGATVVDVTPEGTIDVNKTGSYTGKVKVTFKDGSSRIVDVAVTVGESQASKNTPKGQDITVKKGETPKAEDAIKNKDSLPKGIKYEFKEPVDTKTDGSKDATVVVTYPDGSKDEVSVKVNVASWNSLFNAKGGEFEVPKGTDVKAHDVYEKVKLIFKENGKEFVVGKDNRILLPIGNDSHAWLYVDSAKLPTKDSKVGQYTQNVTINYPDGSKQIVKVVVKVVDKTDADKNPVVAPEKTEVKDKTALTPEEKAEVEKKVKDKNPKAEKVEVGNDGSVTLTYPDNSTNTLTPEQTVTEKAKTDAEKNPAVAPNKTEVENKDKLTDEEKAKVKDEVKKVNPEAKEVEVDDKGNVTITYPDGSTNTLTPDQTITEKGATDAEKVQPNIPEEKTGVKDLDKLTDKEKEKVKNKIEEANKDKFPEGTEVSVDDKGNATITYPDGSKDTIPAEDLVFEYKHGNPEIDGRPELPISDIIDPTIPGKTDVGDKDNLTDKEKEEVKKKIEDANKDKFPEGTKVDVDDKGNATITYPDG